MALVTATMRPKPVFIKLLSNAKTGLGEHPISKIVGLLQELSKECEADVKAEQELFDSYECWKKAVVGAKKASNSEAADRIDALNSYIDDIDSGRIEFSTEGADLTKEVQELRGEVEKSAALRKQDNEDYTVAKEEMESAIAALEGAVETMKE